jgi:hypothetical protein
MIDLQGNLFLKKCFSKALLVCLVASALPAIAPASVLFSNFGAGMSYNTSQGNPIGNDFAGDNAAQAETFTPTVNATFNSLSLALSCVANCSAKQMFTISLTKNTNDAPGAVVEGFVISSSTLGLQGTNNVPFTATSLLDPLLTAGTQYWVTVSSTTAYAISWGDNTTGDTSDQAVSSDGGASWFSPSFMTPSAYQVNATLVAEPSTGILLAGGLLLGFADRRARRSRA